MAYYTNIIFKNRKICFDTSNNDNHKVLTLEHIKAGEILLIEHLASNENEYKIINYVKYNKHLFDNLYPRQKLYNYDDRITNKEEVEKLAVEKVQKNVFSIKTNNEKQYYGIGVYVSKFNHNQNSNTCINISNIGEQKQLTYVAIIANNDIQKGDEITINYGKGYFNETEGSEMPQLYYISNIIKNILCKYMNKQIFDEIYNNLALADCKCVYYYDDETTFKFKNP